MKQMKFTLLALALISLSAVNGINAQTSVRDGSDLPFMHGTTTEVDSYPVESAADLTYATNQEVDCTPTNVQVSFKWVGQYCGAHITWNKPIGGDPACYHIYKGGSYYGDAIAGGTEFWDYDIEYGNTYTWAVEACTGPTGNGCDVSETVSVVGTNMCQAVDCTPTNVQVSFEQGGQYCGAHITWNKPIGGDPVCYNIYKDGSSYNTCHDTEFWDYDIEYGKTYTWAVRACTGPGGNGCDVSETVSVVGTNTCPFCPAFISNITQTKATLFATNCYLSDATIIDKGYEYKLSSDANFTKISIIGDMGEPYTITGLIPNTSHQFRAFVTSAETGTIYGETKGFTTKNVGAEAYPATNVSYTSATINGKTYSGDATVIEQGFIFNDSKILVSNSVSEFSYDVTDLDRETKYCYKTFCTTAGGTVYSDQNVCFTTLSFKQDGDAFLIEDIDDLLLLARLVDEGCDDFWEPEKGCSFAGQKFLLVNDIILPVTPNNINAIGKYDNNSSNRRPFSGDFDGNAKKIYNVYLDHPNTPYQGLFGYVKNGSIYNLGLVNITASGRDYTGGMIAYAENAKITDCYVSGGTLYALSYCGGLIGYQTPGTNSIITSCYNTCSVAGNYYVGGLLGYSDQGTVRNSYVAGAVGGISSSTGAIIGGALNVLMYNCYFNEDITGQSSAIGENTIRGDRDGGEGSMSSEAMRLLEFVTTLNQGLLTPAWKMDYKQPVNDGFPILVWQPEATGIVNVATDSNITLYPNPTSGKLTITCYRHCGLDPQSPENDEIAGQARNDIQNVDVFDLLGRKVLSQKVEGGKQKELDISHLPAGMYFARIQTEQGTVTQKVVKR